MSSVSSKVVPDFTPSFQGVEIARNGKPSGQDLSAVFSKHIENQKLATPFFQNIGTKTLNENPETLSEIYRFLPKLGLISAGVFFASGPMTKALANKITDKPQTSENLSILGSSVLQSGVSCLEQKAKGPTHFVSAVSQFFHPKNFKESSKLFSFEAVRLSAFNLPFFALLNKMKSSVETGNPHLTYQEQLGNGAVLGFGSGVLASIIDTPFKAMAEFQKTSVNNGISKTAWEALQHTFKKDLTDVLNRSSFKDVVAVIAKSRVPYGLYGAVMGFVYSILKSTDFKALTQTNEVKKI